MFFQKNADYSLATMYNNEQKTKRENYRILNNEYTLINQTILLGDSITDFFNWYELFYDFCEKSGQAVYNRGISGDTTDRLLERLEENALNISPKNIVLLIGTNDISRGVPLSVTVENVSKIIENTKNACPDVNFILQAVYPINRGMRDKFEKRSNDKIHLMNKEFIKLSEKYGCTWLDITDDLKDKTGNLRKEYTYDGLHLNISAYKIIAERIIPLLK
ncbi:MAG: hypothetical protein IKW45_06735 [Clostridia bacterium]|nr:hypothetical protein [Clostridia bacterium]